MSRALRTINAILEMDMIKIGSGIHEPLPKLFYELRYNENHDEKGRFTFGKSGGSSGKSVDKSEKNGIIKPSEVSATGKNELRVKGFPSKQKLNNHWQNGRTHAEEYKPDGITTKEQYEKRAVELAESAADGVKILGYKTKEGYICRYDVDKNDYVKADINKGIRTMFKPEPKIQYFYEYEKKEGIKE